MQDTQDL